MVDVSIPVPKTITEWDGSFPKPTSDPRKLAEAVADSTARLRDAKRPILIGGVEIYRERARLAELVNPAAGSAIADIGAGSGCMVELFSKMVGPSGKVYAVDINPKLLERIAARAREQGRNNIETVLTRETSVDLPANSVDMVFICDTYHHFEYPMSSLSGIHRALRPGGEIILVDFNRVPGQSSEFFLEHVRAGQEVFTREIEAAGFERVKQHNVPYLKNNYVLRFRKR